MAKFILIDQSIVDLGGHHYEYAVRVLEAAKAAGYSPVLATNRKFAATTALPWPTIPEYRYGFWGLSGGPLDAVAGGVSRRVRRMLRSVKIGFVYSRMGGLWAARRDLRAMLMRSLQRPSPRLWPWVLLALVGVLLSPVLLLALVAWAFLFGSRKKTLVGRVLRKSLKVALLPARWLVRPPGLLKAAVGHVRKVRAFAADTRRVLRKADVGSDDIVFIPTLGTAELLGLAEVLERDQRARTMGWHLVFRRNIYAGRDAEYSAQDEEQRPLRNALRAFVAQKNGTAVRFYTDTAELTAQYNRLAVATFETLPIPVAEAFELRPERVSTGPARIVYAGDARTEKGYAMLPRLVSAVASDLLASEKAVFELQSNFNGEHGEPRVAVARALLLAQASDALTLHLTPLASGAYRALVGSADVVLVLYDAREYAARSSGVFVEAMCAGIPTVVSAGSWMALEVAEEQARYHQTLRQRMSRARTERLEQRAFRLVPGRPFPEEGDGRRDEVESSEPDLPRWDAPSAGTVRARGELALGGTMWRSVNLSVEAGATHLILSAHRTDALRGEFVRLAFRELDARGDVISVHEATVGSRSGVLSHCVRLSARTRGVDVAVRGAYSGRPVQLGELRIELGELPTGTAVGTVAAIYSSEAQAAQVLRELVDHLGHYRETARRFGESYRKAHSAVALVRLMAGEALPAPSVDYVPMTGTAPVAEITPAAAAGGVR